MQKQMKIWNVCVCCVGGSIYFGQVYEVSEDLVCCVVLLKFGVSDDEVELGMVCVGIYLVDDFDVFLV